MTTVHNTVVGSNSSKASPPRRTEGSLLWKRRVRPWPFPNTRKLLDERYGCDFMSFEHYVENRVHSFANLSDGTIHVKNNWIARKSSTRLTSLALDWRWTGRELGAEDSPAARSS